MDIYNLLNINADKIRDFHLLANNVIGMNEEKVLRNNIKKLERIEDNMLVNDAIKVEPKSIDDVIRKVLRISPKNDYSPENWNFFELRIISYYLNKLRNNHDAYVFATKLLDKNWKDLFINGLVFCLMGSWHSLEPEYKELTSSLLISKLKIYKGNSKRYNLFKNHANLFESAGPVRMAAILSQKGLRLEEAPEILGFRAANLKQQYYSDVIITYLRKNSIKDLDFIEDVFQLNDLDRTKKLAMAHLVKMEDERPDMMFRTKLCRFANRILGDITLATSWAPFVGSTEEDVSTLRTAMYLVNKWFKQKTIETFFEICVQDVDRKKFWLQYVDYIDTFRIVGSLSVKRKLQASNKLGIMLMKMFIETNSEISQTSALVLFIKNRMIVEFSDVGAVYVYEHDHSIVKYVVKGDINSTNDLKNTNVGQLMDQYSWGSSYYSYGRMTHRGRWQERLSGWLDSELLKNSVKRYDFFKEEQKNIFKTVPLPKEPELAFHESRTVRENNNSRDNAFISVNNKDVQQKTDNDKRSDVPRFTGKKLGNIKYKMISKIVDDNAVVADEHAYYINNLRKHIYILLKPLDKGEVAVGNIWLKKTDSANWKEIVHFYMGNEKSIGFININSSSFKFKESINSNTIYKSTF